VVNDIEGIFINSKFGAVFSDEGFNALIKLEFWKLIIFYIFLFKFILFIFYLRVGYNMDKDQLKIDQSKNN
jgi:uncharacterized membrane protein YdbT with pleckstrin-like domain